MRLSLLSLVGGVLAGILSIGIASCSRERIVAEVLGQKITADQFAERYGKFRELGSGRDNVLQREKILNNMINEILIYDDCRRKGFDRDKVYESRMHDITLQALLDIYARHISLDSVRVTEQELWNEFRSFNSKVAARYVYASTEAEAWNLKDRLERGESFESIAREVFQDAELSKNGGYLGYFGYGEMELPFEEAAYALQPGVLSDPVKIRTGYAIIRVENRVQVPLLSESDFAKRKPKLEDAIRERKMHKILAASTEQIAQSLQPEFDEEGVQLAFQCWPAVFGTGRDVLSLESPAAPNPAQAAHQLVRFAKESWTVGEFFRRADQTSEKQRRHVRSPEDIKSVAEGLAIRGVLIERAKAEGLERDPRVRSQVERVRDDFLLRRWAGSIEDTVGSSGWNEDTLRAYFEQNMTQFAVPPQLNVAEILTRSKEEADLLMTKLRKGANFESLARQYSVRTSTAQQGGEIGWGPAERYGSMAKKFLDARIGALLGPETIAPYYGIFKVLGKRPGRQRTFEESRDDIKQAMLPLRKKEAVLDVVEMLRARSQFTADLQALANIVISN
jgi:foldase protein PrsA